MRAPGYRNSSSALKCRCANKGYDVCSRLPLLGQVGYECSEEDEREIHHREPGDALQHMGRAVKSIGPTFLPVLLSLEVRHPIPLL